MLKTRSHSHSFKGFQTLAHSTIEDALLLHAQPQHPEAAAGLRRQLQSVTPRATASLQEEMDLERPAGANIHTCRLHKSRAQPRQPTPSSPAPSSCRVIDCKLSNADRIAGMVLGRESVGVRLQRLHKDPGHRDTLLQARQSCALLATSQGRQATHGQLPH